MKKRKEIMKKINKNRYILPSRDIRKGYIQKNFNQIAKDYNTFNNLITLGLHKLWKKRLIQLLLKDHPSHKQQSQPMQIIDLCCGTGDLSLELYKQSKGTAKITSIDFSDKMLAIFQSRIPKKAKQIHIMQEDASKLQNLFEKESIDALCIGFGLRNLLDREDILKQILSLLKPGGRIGILDVGEVRIPIIKEMSHFFFTKIVPLVGHLYHGKRHEMYEYLPASMEGYPKQKELKQILETIGFQEVYYVNVMFGAATIHIGVK